MTTLPAGVRLAPLDPPYDPDLGRTLARMMPPGVPPLKLFRTVAHNRHLLDKLRSTGTYLLNFGTIEPRARELVILRTCARCRCEYEWGVHVHVFAAQVGLSEAQIAATVTASAADEPWAHQESLLIALVDELHETGNLSDRLWHDLAEHYSSAQLVELVALAGHYHGVSFLANALGVELEDGAARFPEPQAGGSGQTPAIELPSRRH
jgi:alkylhydroperoxidase family enzyme